jgi:ERCC4-like helicases
MGDDDRNHHGNNDDDAEEQQEEHFFVSSSKRPTKKIKRGDETPYNHQHDVQEGPDDPANNDDNQVLVATASASSSSKTTTTEAHNFLFRSPARPEEIDQIANKLRSRINNAYEEIATIGFDAFREKYNKFITFEEKTPKITANADGTDLDGKGGENEGVDTDDEMTQYQKDKTAAAILQEAVVRGDPRRYQTALVEMAKKRNTIVHLGTGQGKTLIALLLIRHYADQDDYMLHRKQTLFLVPSVALAMQHTTTLLANLPYTVATACNNASVKASTSREDMAAANILVATHGAARDLFMHYGEMFSFERINLLIVDECHYASGDHEYATIMRNFYHRLPREKRPRVLGLTASPLVNIKCDTDDDKLRLMLDELENIMDSKLASLPKLGITEEEMGHTSRESEERCVFYHGQPGSVIFDLPKHDNIGLHEVRVREFKQFVELYRDLGPKLTSIYSATVARELSINRYDQESKEQFLL